MIRILRFIWSNSRKMITGAFFVLTSVIITYLLPQEGKFMYEFQKGGYWKHEDLTAPFSFPIHKTDLEIRNERDSALAGFRPVFNINRQLSEDRIKQLEEDFSNSWIDFSVSTFGIPSRDVYRKDSRYAVNRQLENEYRLYLTTLIRDIYLKGIIDTAPLEKNNAESYSSVMVVNGNLAEYRTVNELYTPKSAYEYIMDRLRGSIPGNSNLVIRKYDAFFEDLELNNYLAINVVYDETKSKSLNRSLINGISLTRSMIQEGQGIISKGEFIDDEKFIILESLRQEYEQNLGFIARKLVIIGKFMLTLLSLAIIYFFLRNFRKVVLTEYRRTTFILLAIILMVLVAGVTLKYNLASIYIIPFAILPIILNAFFDSRLSLFVHIITVLLVGFFVPNGFEFVFLNVFAGMVSVMSLANIYRRSRIIVTALVVILTYSVIFTGMSLLQEGSLLHMQFRYFSWFGINGILILISYPLIYMFEKTFGFISDATLMELSDTNQPLLRQLAELAPGTFQHSLQVANLAEDAVHNIGGNPLLVRAGALYHDIGKLNDPIYFIENQTGSVNPHDALDFEHSASIIIDHVRKGVELARKSKLPEAIIDFIRTHHGSSTVQYFYKSYLNKYPESEVDMKKFSYPGPRPISKETAIVMMADSVEAASRSLKTISDNTLDKLVDGIIANQMTEEQYNDAQITFRDITIVREVFKKRLRNIHHMRISYPH